VLVNSSSPLSKRNRAMYAHARELIDEFGQQPFCSDDSDSDNGDRVPACHNPHKTLPRSYARVSKSRGPGRNEASIARPIKKPTPKSKTHPQQPNSEYERRRDANMARNKALFEQLQRDSEVSGLTPRRKQTLKTVASKKRTREVEADWTRYDVAHGRVTRAAAVKARVKASAGEAQILRWEQSLWDEKDCE